MKFNKLIPELAVSDLGKSLKFYKRIGFKTEYIRTEDKFAFLSFQGSQIMLQQKNKTWNAGKLEHPFGRGINFQIEVKSIDWVIGHLKNWKLFEKPTDNWYRANKKLFGCREFLVQDPDGYLLRFSQDLGTKKI